MYSSKLCRDRYSMNAMVLLPYYPFYSIGNFASFYPKCSIPNCLHSDVLSHIPIASIGQPTYPVIHHPGPMHVRVYPNNKTLNPDEQAQLRDILQGCTNVLEGLDKLHIKYMRLGSDQGSSSQAIDRIKWTQENITELRARLTSNITLLNTFIQR